MLGFPHGIASFVSRDLLPSLPAFLIQRRGNKQAEQAAGLAIALRFSWLTPYRLINTM